VLPYTPTFAQRLVVSETAFLYGKILFFDGHALAFVAQISRTSTRNGRAPFPLIVSQSYRILSDHFTPTVPCPSDFLFCARTPSSFWSSQSCRESTLSLCLSHWRADRPFFLQFFFFPLPLHLPVLGGPLKNPLVTLSPGLRVEPR